MKPLSFFALCLAVCALCLLPTRYAHADVFAGGPGDATDLDAQLTSVTVTPSPLPGGAPAIGTVHLKFAVFIDTPVYLTCIGASVPEYVIVPALRTSEDFPIKTQAVAAAQTLQIGAFIRQLGRYSRTSGDFTVRPAGAVIALYPPAVRGGLFSSGVLTLDAPASTPLTITLRSSTPGVTLPKTSVLLSPRQTMATFTILTSPVTTAANAVITASVNGQTSTAKLSITP